ncbi:hypothetical protein VTO42DRAFT_8084 [Malbranchea cinnamomea]
MAAKASMFRPINETENSFTRITREGRKLFYLLRVIQQPERARACGAGAKANADRRPVDPPPVVQLRIFECDHNDVKTDITLSYNASFFMYASLEFARPMAHGRVHGQPPCPVLTGVPVAGIAYLDRPSQAGYFIFPDLSVRHEGLYRLNFSLYEGVKDPKDGDKDAPLYVQDSSIVSSPMNPVSPQNFMQFRVDVRSIAFTVYSAKKFPGLAESTPLSRMVAEQGCRVRIRRDVRLRRRDSKTGTEYGYDDDHLGSDAYPGTPVQRPRSGSNASMDNPYGYCPTPQPDLSYTPQSYHHASPIPPPTGPPPVPGPQSHLSFGALQSQYCAPQLPPQAPAQRPPQHPSPHPGYAHVRHASGGSEYDAQTARDPRYSSPRPQNERVDQAKASLPPIARPPDMPLTYARPNDYRVSESRPYQQMPIPSPISPPPKTPVNASHSQAVPYPQYLPADDFPPSQPPSTSVMSPNYDPSRKGPGSYETNPVLSKRTHGDVFGSDQHSQRLSHRQRPDNESPKDSSSRNTQGSGLNQKPIMTYLRANGSVSSKPDRLAAITDPASRAANSSNKAVPISPVQ